MSRGRKKLPPPREAVIESLNQDGAGVAHVEGKAVFIDGALPGEQVIYETTFSKRTFDRGKALEILLASPDRVEPRCGAAAICGGCSLQHMAAGAQILAKQQVLLDNLQHIAKIAPDEVFEPVTADAWGYRRRARFGVRYVPAKGGALVGFREKQKSFIADHTECPVLTPKLEPLLPELRLLVEALSCRERIPQIEVADSEMDTVLIFRHLVPLTESDLRLLEQFAARHAVYIKLQPGGPDSAHDLIAGQSPRLGYSLPNQDLSFRFDATDFIQVNDSINQHMVARALELLKLQANDSVLDLFCGLGNFTLPLARHAKQVTGIEGSAVLIERARENAAGNQIGNVRFEVADLYAVDCDIRVELEQHNKILLDPPRSGAIEVVKQFAKTRPERIVYVSCNPATLARDTACLVHSMGYRLLGAGVLDMFPHTTHVESIAVFEPD